MLEFPKLDKIVRKNRTIGFNRSLNVYTSREKSILSFPPSTRCKIIFERNELATEKMKPSLFQTF